MKWVITGFILFCAVSAQAAAVWTKEPDTVLGIKFDVPFAENNIPYCGSAAIGQMCASTQMDTTMLILPPDLGFVYEATVVSTGSPNSRRVAGIAISTDQSNFTMLAKAMLYKYGPPNLSKTEIVKNNAGAKFNSTVYSWTGKHIELTVTEHDGKEHTSTAIFTSLKTAEEDAVDSNNRVMSGMQKF